MSVLTIDLKDRAYEVLIQRGGLDALGREVKARLGSAARAAVITDANVAPLYGERVLQSLEAAGLQPCLAVLEPGERTKSLQTLEKLYDFLGEHRLNRWDAVIALGGGVIGDTAGMAAATYMRGLPLVQVPTSLLAQVDSAVGGKVAVNLPRGKNLCGCFYQPRLVLADPDVLKTLPDACWRDGMGEVIKYGCIRDGSLFDRLCALTGREALMEEMEEILTACLRVKADLVMADERDTGARMLLNFGHTLGHAFEAAGHFEGLSHGEAVAVGMALITRMSQSRGFTRPGTLERLEACLKAHGLPLTARAEDRAAFDTALALDKKHGAGGLKAVILESIGNASVQPAPWLAEVAQWL